MGSRSLPIRTVLLLIFISLLVSTLVGIGYITYSNWIGSTREMLTELAADMNSRIFAEVEDFMQVPIHIVQSNLGLLASGAVDLSNAWERERFFVAVLEAHSSDGLYSFSFGSVRGEYYGARRNAENEVEIMRNNEITGGHSWYYTVTPDMTAGERTVDAGRFDPRTRAWYQAAVETGGLVFSPLYKHFVMDDLTISASMPVYGNDGVLQGVLGAHVTLSRIDGLLQELTVGRSAVAAIMERESGHLVANSLGQHNFIHLADGGIGRLTIADTGHVALIETATGHASNGGTTFQVDGGDDRFYTAVDEFSAPGLDWLVVSAVPESPLIAGIRDTIMTTGAIMLLALLLSVAIYRVQIGRLLRPIDSLIGAAGAVSRGNLADRVPIVRNDEIGSISAAFNHMADTIHRLVNNLEETVRDRTSELEQSNRDLQQTRDRLQLILDSTAEAVFGLDIRGNCTFINASGLRLLGYGHQDELIGRNLHELIHHSYADGRPMPIEECAIARTLVTGQGAQRDNEVFWRVDGSSFDVVYHSYPQYRNGEVIGVVVTFLDNTERKRQEDHIKYLTYHDQLTGLYNRVFFDAALDRLDTDENLPISIIFGDANGLKLTNDIFGHQAGDALLQRIADTLRSACRPEDIVARVGGDEFAMILPNTEADRAGEIVEKVRGLLSQEQIIAVKCSMSLGFATKTEAEENIAHVMTAAEDAMYQRKTLDRPVTNSDLVQTITDTLHARSPRERAHSQNVSLLCQRIARALNMSETDVRKLRDAGYLHDIGKIVLDEQVLNKAGQLTEGEHKEMRQHPIVGYRILNLFDHTVDLSEGVLNHHERWDGSGYPKGIKGDEIPLVARVIAIAEAYDAILRRGEGAVSEEAALQEIAMLAGRKFDPMIARLFVDIMRGEE
ncbi:MAG: diguanylate cyclase domain-containing protein [Bacillota bacterium]